MGILNFKYKRLTPDIDLLSDEAVVIQAWKKCDKYIRQYNWYADILELEKATLTLPDLIPKWCGEIAKGKVSPDQKMRLVLAPKNAKWIFPENSGLKKSDAWKSALSHKDNAAGLRPLAHIGIREQTFAVAAMLCLANMVESVQGNTDQETNSEAQKQNVYSYGNRLFCDWLESPNGKQLAHYRWGNEDTYSQFFRDYERFLFRPVEICQEVARNRGKDRLYVIKLDLSKFYDRIDRSVLINELNGIRDEYNQSFKGYEIDDEQFDRFCEYLEEMMTWQWDIKDKKKNDFLSDNGLPQGLVASGFFANAYMHRFDQTIGGQIGTKIKEGSVHYKLLDYCRYVDDMRLVVAIEENLNADKLASIISSSMDKMIKKHSKSLSLNKDKTEAISWEDFAVQGSTSSFMRGIQKQISQAPDPLTLMNATGNLDHLLWVAETIEDETDQTNNPLELAHIAKPKSDVRDDTIQRFAANRLRKVLRLRRSMADAESINNEPGTSKLLSERDALDHEIEAIARKLIACFAKNPALTSVLRCGLGMFPSPDLLLPVLDALEAKIAEDAKQINQKEQTTALYILSDLLKAGAIETGFAREESYPISTDIEGYRNELTRLALNLVSREGLPWFVYQQAMLFLAAVHYPSMVVKGTLLKSYNSLHRALKYRKPRYKMFEEDFCSGLIVLEMTGNQPHFETWICEWLNRVKPSQAVDMVDKIALYAPKVLKTVCRKWKKNPRKRWYTYAHKTYLSPANKIERKIKIADWGDNPISLRAIVNHPQNPFVQENAILKLIDVLVENEETIPLDSDLTLNSIFVTCENWATVQNPETDIDVAYEKDNRQFPWNIAPDWCEDEMKWAYHLGRLIRSAIVGEEDFTSRFFPEREVLNVGYRGLKTSWYKRRVGLIPVNKGLGEEVTPISPWLNELVMCLLQWPGLEIGNGESIGFQNIKYQADLRKIIENRKKYLDSCFGKLSNLPVYILSANEDENRDLSKFRVAIVQSSMPLEKDFCKHNPSYWKPDYRATHRAHLASMCRLLIHQMRNNQIPFKNGNDIQDRLDLIVFPELTVHPDDMWLLSRLSDQTKATVFAGQTYIDHLYLQRPINRGVWLLRQENKSGRNLVQAFQGKKHVTTSENDMGVTGHRPFQIVINFKDKKGKTANLTGVICYDATDLELAADLREITDGVVISALNKDTNTFDSMVRALQYHMYQTVILSNTGEFGGSTAQAPYKESFERLISHVHGKKQAMVTLFEIDLLAFKDPRELKIPKKKKTPPAGYKGRRV